MVTRPSDREIASQSSASAKPTRPLRARRNHEGSRSRRQDNPRWPRECSALLPAPFLLATSNREARGNSPLPFIRLMKHDLISKTHRKTLHRERSKLQRTLCLSAPAHRAASNQSPITSHLSLFPSAFGALPFSSEEFGIIFPARGEENKVSCCNRAD
jgi:hypothetical protein